MDDAELWRKIVGQVAVVGALDVLIERGIEGWLRQSRVVVLVTFSRWCFGQRYALRDPSPRFP